MRRSVSSAFAALVLLATCALIPSPEVVHATQADSVADSAATGHRGRVVISIDESGISVEGSGGEESGDWIVLEDGRRWKEKGTDIVRFGEGIFVASDEEVRGDLVLIGADAIIEGRVTGDVLVVGGSIRVRSGAQVLGNTIIIGGGTLDEDDDVVIRGERIEIGTGVEIRELMERGREMWRWVGLFVFVVGLTMSLLVVLFIPERVGIASDHVYRHTLRSFGAGVLTILVGVPVSVVVGAILLVTVIGIPLGLFVITSWVGFVLLAWTAAAHTVGRFVAPRLRTGGGTIMLVFIGTVALCLPDLVATVVGVLGQKSLAWGFDTAGCVIRILAGAIGLGALVTSRLGGRGLAPTSSS